MILDLYLSIRPCKILSRAFNRSGATRAVALNISRAFDRCWHAGLLHWLKSYEISAQIFGLISSFLNNKWIRLVLDGKCSQEYPVIAGVPQGSVLRPTPFLLYVNDLDNVICNIAIYPDDTTLYSNCHQASDKWQQFELASELEFDLRDTMDWDKKWLADFSAGKTQLVSFDQSNNTGSIDVKQMGLYLRKNHLLRCWGWPSLLNWTGALTLSLLLKLRSSNRDKFVLNSFYEVSFSLVAL